METFCDQCGKYKKDVYRGRCQTCYRKNLIKQRQDSAPKILCGDGCGELIPSIGKNGLPQRFKNGHASKGQNNGMYEKGWFIRDGYKFLTGYHGHPNANKKGEIREHVLVMSNYIRRPLTKLELVHHINNNKLDNRIENLQLVSRPEHQNIHNPRKYFRKDYTGVVCIECGSDTTYPSKNGQPHWCLHPITKEKYVCEKCYKRIKFQNKIQISNRRKDFSDRICCHCGAETSLDSIGSSTWRSVSEDGYYVCKSCFDVYMRT